MRRATVDRFKGEPEIKPDKRAEPASKPGIKTVRGSVLASRPRREGRARESASEPIAGTAVSQRNPSASGRSPSFVTVFRWRTFIRADQITI